jgi:hypothetical protein
MPIKKREIAAYIILLNLGEKEIPLKEALKLLEIFYSRRTARKILRMLNNAGFIEIYSDLIRLNDCRSAFRNFLIDYIRSIAYRRLKSFNIGEVKVNSKNSITVECREGRSDLCEKREIEIKDLVKIIFIHPQKTQ